MKLAGKYAPLWLTAATIAAVLVLVACKRPPDASVLGFLGAVLTAFLAHQWTTSKRQSDDSGKKSVRPD